MFQQHIYGTKDILPDGNPHVVFHEAKYLSSHKYVVETFIERIEEIFNDESNNFMNCSLCKYRSNLFGFEKEVGLIQESHHDHVEGIDLSCELCHSECNGACETNSQNSTEAKDQSELLLKKTHDEHQHKDDDHHHHHHSIYPNSKHPLGPVTLRLLSNDQILRNSVEKD